MDRRCYSCDVPLRQENVSPVTDDACRSCVPVVTDFEMAEAMTVYGGSFVKVLGQLWLKGDPINRAKILAVWPEYCAEYRELVRLKRAKVKA